MKLWKRFPLALSLEQRSQWIVIRKTLKDRLNMGKQAMKLREPWSVHVGDSEQDRLNCLTVSGRSAMAVKLKWLLVDLRLSGVCPAVTKAPSAAAGTGEIEVGEVWGSPGVIFRLPAHTRLRACRGNFTPGEHTGSKPSRV